jgi:hypothetical protein
MTLLTAFIAITFNPCVPAEQNDPLDPNGSEVFVRVYTDWRKDPAAFEMTAVPLQGGGVDCNLYDANENTIVVITAEDQDDPVVRQALGDVIYAEPYKTGLTYTLGQYNRNSSQNRPRRLVDGLGNPLVGATAEIHLVCHSPAVYRIGLGRVVLEGTNEFKVPIAAGKLNTFEIILSHPDYGIAKTGIYEHDDRDEVFVPVLKPESEERKRCIRGRVVDPDGLPVPGTSISSCTLCPPGGGRLTCNRGYTVITDEQGRFCMYLPLPDGKLVPIGSEYEVSIAPPRRLMLRSPCHKIANGKEQTIVLEHKEDGHFHTFVFEDTGERITDVEKLKNIAVTVKTQRTSHRYIYALWKDGGIFPPGQYRAAVKWTEKKVQFEPIVVTADSPRELVFRAKYPRSTYSGRVVHGITAEPVSGVLLVCAAGRADAGILRAARQWEATLAPGDDPGADCNAPASSPPTDVLSKLARTDEHGRFEVAYEPGKDNYFTSFSAAAEGYLIGWQERPDLTADPLANPDAYFELPDIRLFPTARVVLEPYSGSTTGEPSIIVNWWAAREDNPAWRDALQLLAGSAWASFNKVCHMDVAAGFSLRLRLRVNESTEISNPCWAPIIVKGINVEPGRTLDLGRLEFDRMLPVYVEVVNSGGKPLEGITVRHTCDRYFRKCWDNTDEQGIVVFSAPVGSMGEFGVFADRGSFNIFGPDKDEPSLKESIAYEIRTAQDANSVYTLRLSDQILQELLK